MGARRSALGWGKLFLALGSLGIFWALGARRTAGVIFFCARLLENFLEFLLLAFFPLLLESLIYICFNLIILTIIFCLVCYSPLFKFINNLFLKCGAFNIQAYKHF